MRSCSAGRRPVVATSAARSGSASWSRQAGRRSTRSSPATSERESRCSCSSRCRTAGRVDYERWLRELGLEPFDAQDRVVRDASPLTLTSNAAGDRELTVERVTDASAAEWVEFMERVYRLDTGPWLPRLIGRPGWHQYVVREARRDRRCARDAHRPGRHRLARHGRPRPRRHDRATTSPTRRSAHSSSPTASPAARARSSPTSSRRHRNRRRPPTSPSHGSASRGRTYAPTGHGADARLPRRTDARGQARACWAADSCRASVWSSFQAIEAFDSTSGRKSQTVMP